MTERLTTTVHLRLDSETIRALDEIARIMFQRRTDVIRRCLREGVQLDLQKYVAGADEMYALTERLAKI